MDLARVLIGRTETGRPWVLRLLDRHILVAGVSDAGKSSVMWAVLRALAPWARHGAVTINPVRETARIEGTPRRRPRSMTAEEGQQWLAALEASEPARLWDLPDLSLMMLANGCRIGECLAIGWDEIDLDQATVDVCWRLVRRTGVGLLRLPSTTSGESGSSRYRAGRDDAHAAAPCYRLGGPGGVR